MGERNKFQLRLQIDIYSDRGDRLQVSETTELNEMEFLDMTRVIGRFHGLVNTVRAEHLDGR